MTSLEPPGWLPKRKPILITKNGGLAKRQMSLREHSSSGSGHFGSRENHRTGDRIRQLANGGIDRMGASQALLIVFIMIL